MSHVGSTFAPGIARAALAAASPPAAERVATAARPRRYRLEEVYEANFDYVWRCLRSLGVPPATVDDAAHDVFLVVHRRLAEFDDRRGALRSWLYAIALRVARRHRDRASRTVALDPRWDAPSRHTPYDDAEHAGRLALLDRCLSCLDDDKREVFVLAEIEQLSCPEIAAVTGVKLNTVYSRLRVARQRFQEELARQRGPEKTP